MNLYEFYVCKDPDEWGEGQKYTCPRTATAAAKLKGLYVIEATYSYEDSELIYEPPKQEEEEDES